MDKLSNISSKIIQSQQLQATDKDAVFDQVQDTIVAAIVDLKEEVMIYSQGIRNKGKNIDQVDDKKTIGQELKDIQDQNQVQQTSKIEHSDAHFEKRAEFVKENLKSTQMNSDEIGEFAASILQDANIKKTKKQNSLGTLEKKLELLASLEPDFKALNLAGEEKEVVEEFFDKMARMKNLKNRLTQLDHIEKKHQQTIDEQEKKNQNQNQNQQHQQRHHQEQQDQKREEP